MPTQSQRKANSKTNHFEAWVSIIYSISCSANSHSTPFRFKRLSDFQGASLTQFYTRRITYSILCTQLAFNAVSISAPFRLSRSTAYSILHSTDPHLLPFRPLRTLAPFGSLPRTVTNCRLDVRALADPSDACMFVVSL